MVHQVEYIFSFSARGTEPQQSYKDNLEMPYKEIGQKGRRQAVR